MIELASPDTLGSRAAFRQASSLLRQTSRASNPDWYRQSMEVDHQWHIVIVSSSRVYSVLRVVSTDTWLPGPAVNFASPSLREDLDAALDDVFSREDFGRARSLGVVLHIADEFATTELSSDLKTTSSLTELREELRVNPSAVLGDPSLAPEATSTRLVPYAGAEKPPLASTVTLSGQHAATAEMLRSLGEERNLPVLVQSLSAPLAFLAILPAFLSIEGDRPRFVLLHYSRFSALAVLDAGGNLLQLRALAHRGRLFPSNLGDAINTAVESLDLGEPAISILPMSDADPSPLLTQLHATLNAPEKAEMRVLRPSLEGIADHVEALRPEMLIAVPDFASSEVSPGFHQLYGEGWAFQDFHPVPGEIARLYPDRGDMQLLSVGRLLLLVLAMATVGLFGWATFSVVRITTSPAWAHDTTRTAGMSRRLAESNRELAEFSHWENLLQQRSKGWLTLEFLTRLFPEDGNTLVTNYTTQTRLDAVQRANRVGFSREWVIDGYAREEANPLLIRLGSREGMAEVFANLLEVTGNQSFNMDVEGRNLVVDIKRSANAGYKPALRESTLDKDGYPIAFNLRITQTFGPKDPMAINTKPLSSR